MHCLGRAGLAVALALAVAGCRLSDPGPGVIASAPPPPLGQFEPAPADFEPAPKTRRVERRLQPANIVPAAHRQPQPPADPPEPLPSPSDHPDPPPAPTVSDYDGLLIEGQELPLEQLMAEVEARNPSLQAMVAAWQAAAEKYPQAVALDDPMFMAMLAPAALGADDVPGGQQLQVTQRIPWPGKRRARGQVAQSEAEAAFHDAEDARVQLALMTQMAFYDYYLARQQARLNAENTQILTRFRETAQVRYQTNLVTQQDVLQADVELAELARRQLELKRMERVAAARINTLLRRQPDAPLPAPAALPQPAPAEEPSLLISQALGQRQDLAALAHRIEAEQASLELAYKQFYPDVDVIGAYNAMMPDKEMWGQVGVGLNVPLYRQKRHAAVNEAELRVSQRVAEYEQKQLDIQYEVQQAFERLEETRQTVELYRQKLIPTAQLNVEATRANYENAKSTFLDLAVAQRQLIELREKEQEAAVSYHQRLAELQRAIGGP
jgi:outer membrane protein, heavy metal efflux system